ncbi:putative chromatin assembly factor 1 subunit A [Helianthus annuus]|nr:putative chromatin assembly factor 1 subunit A [Helianthus annuus]KAJ0821158.1 putative chromatin assembly factor 1 subunit A [Helianthus annuus]
MGDPMVIDVAKKSTKRKRVEMVMSLEERMSRIGVLREEIEGLMKYYNEGFGGNRLIDVGTVKEGCSSNMMIACLLEESRLPLSKLVESIFGLVKEKDGAVTEAAVKSSVILIGQRCCYGVQNVNADVLEDESASCLWCWETRDIKLLPKSLRGATKIRRTCRKKIHERITAVSAVITELMKPDNTSDSGQKIMKASERLSKVLGEAEIRSLVDKMEQKNGADVAEKDVKREEKLAVKQLEKNKREAEKEKIRMERELLKEKLQTEKEQKRLQEEAEKEEKRRENEIKKQLKKQQEEAEKEQRRREKEEAEQKKQLALQKQASILERFLIKSKNNSPVQVEQSTIKESATCISPQEKERVPDTVIQSMDNALSSKREFDAKELWKVHLNSWHQSSHCSSRKRHWGIRRTPKTALVKELKLTSKGEDDPTVEKFDDGWIENESKTNATSDGSASGSQKPRRRKQLLQFDKNHRPAFYGYWPKKSDVVRGRCPLAQDPDLDYEIDSDEEWEEEEPGESLSDCEKEEDDENMEENLSKADDEDESEDGFFVPDGYLSENEGVEVDRMDASELTEDAKSSPNCVQTEIEELSVLFRQLKHLNTLTEHALRKNKPVVILNLMHEKSKSNTNSLSTQDRSESEQMCLQALSICAFPVGPSIEISTGDDVQEEVQDDHPTHPSSSKSNAVPAASGVTTTISDSDLPEIVSVIQSCPHGINKVVNSLRLKFPNIPKSQLGNKVREISVFTDNRWQVKKDILEKLGLSSSPEKTVKRTKSIAAFFSKRCLPPTGKTTNPNQVSPQPMEKSSAAVEMQMNTYNNQ